MGYKKLVQSGSLVETYEYKYDYIERRVRRVKSRTRAVRSKCSPVRNRRADNLYRLRGKFARLIRANLVGIEVPFLITFTLLENIPIGEAYGLFTQCIQRLRVRYGKAFRYVAVPEFQHRGAIHFHMVAFGLPDEVILHEGSIGNKYTRWRYVEWANKKGYTLSQFRNTRAIQRLWSAGFVDCIPSDGSIKLVGYLAKYMHKAMSDERLVAQKAYIASRNVLRPVQVTHATVLEYLPDIVGDTLPDRQKKWETQWLGPCQYKRYQVGL